MTQKKENLWAPRKSWEYDETKDDNIIFTESIYEMSKEKEKRIQHFEHMQDHKNIAWTECTINNCSEHCDKKNIAWWYSQEKNEFEDDEKYHWHIDKNMPDRARMCFRFRCVKIRLEISTVKQYKEMTKIIRQAFSSEDHEF